MIDEAVGGLFDLAVAAIEKAHRDPYRRRERLSGLRGRALVWERAARSVGARQRWAARLASLAARLASLDLEIERRESREDA